MDECTLIVVGQAFSEDVCNSPVTLGGYREKGRDTSSSLHMHGWVGRRSLIVIPLYILFLFIYAYIDLGKLAPISQQFYHAW